MGSITYNGNSIHYLVRSVSELEIIIKHFDRYPLLSKKYADFVLFKSVFNLVKDRDYSDENILKVAAIKASINKGLSGQLKKEFSDLVPALRPQANDNLIPDPFWLTGFIEGEGCFYFSYVNMGIGFSITLTSSQAPLMNAIKNYLDSYSIEDVNLKASSIYQEIISQRTHLYTKKKINRKG